MTSLIKGFVTKIARGESSQIAVQAFVQGGLIVNPYTAADQELALAEVLYVDPTGQANDVTSSTTIPLYPGESYSFNSLSSSPIYVNAASSGHAFTVIQFSSPPNYPPIPITGPFPPPGPTTMTNVIPSYLYQEYSDDDTLQAFVDSYNIIAQDYIDALNDLNLPIYTNANISGGLLDWVGSGLYGYPRPTLSTFTTVVLGELNTWEFNSLMLNESETLYPGIVTVTTDDTYKRLLTWHFYKGDGKYFTVPWLKRRIMRFLIGVNGSAPNISQTYQISVTFGTNNTVTIRFISFLTYVSRSAQFNFDEFNTTQLNELNTYTQQLDPLPYQEIFKEAVNSAALELPFQFSWNVVLNSYEVV